MWLGVSKDAKVRLRMSKDAKVPLGMSKARDQFGR